MCSDCACIFIIISGICCISWIEATEYIMNIYGRFLFFIFENIYHNIDIAFVEIGKMKIFTH